MRERRRRPITKEGGGVEEKRVGYTYAHVYIYNYHHHHIIMIYVLDGGGHGTDITKLSSHTPHMLVFQMAYASRPTLLFKAGPGLHSTRYGPQLMGRRATRLGRIDFYLRRRRCAAAAVGEASQPALPQRKAPFSSHHRLRRMRYCCFFALIFFQRLIGWLRMRTCPCMGNVWIRF